MLLLARRRFAPGVVGIAALAMLAGCGQKEPKVKGRATASGTVTLDGQPVPGGAITVVSKENPIIKTTISIYDGAFNTDRVPIGVCLIGIDSDSVPDQAGSSLDVPDRYRDPESSGLTAEFKEGENTDVDFALTSEE